MAEVEIPNPEELKENTANRFSRNVALMTACFAVILAFTSLGGNNASKEMMLAQQETSNQWAFYQSKTIRENMYKLERVKLSAALVEKGKSMTPEARAEYDKLLGVFTAEEQRYNSEKKEIEQKAKQKENERDLYLAKDPYFDYAEVLLQISIVMASIAIIAGSFPVMVVSAVVALIGAFFSFNGFFMLLKLPFMN
ncbi:MAG: DUF4337 domain-containing protein [Oligoflexales bacterium]|nr:DUF4337 domain-containing protein [Oligoflexales bacterium]